MYKIAILILLITTILSTSFGVFYYKKSNKIEENLDFIDKDKEYKIVEKEKVVYKTSLPFL